VKILIDTDVLLDTALARQPYLASSGEVLRWSGSVGEGVIAWHSLSNCAYLLKDSGRPFLSQLLQIVTVANVGTSDAVLALRLQMSDCEDALQAASALACGADYIVTRNLADYRHSPIPALDPATFLLRAGND